jgi:large conductance mechanosensitive channel
MSRKVFSMKKMLRNSLLAEFREFINRGNLLAIAIGFVLGGSFSGLVTALVENVIMPLVAIPFGEPNFDTALVLTINDAEIRFGAFLTVAVTFLSIAFVLFVLLKVYNRATGAVPTPPQTEVALLGQIHEELQAIRHQGETRTT